jgi:formylglycine-generating enzyme required for sulfatase activity
MKSIAFAIVLVSLAAAGGARGQGATFRDCSRCPEMVAIAPGAFTMGVPPGEEEQENVPELFRHLSEPQHRVEIQEDYAVGRYAVTRAEFDAFVVETRYRTGPGCRTYSLSDHRWDEEERPGSDWQRPGFAQTARDPVVCVSWDDARAYAAWLSRRTGYRYRLPSEAEWEYAARAGSPQARFWGDRRDEACHYANVADVTMFAAAGLRPGPDRSFACSDGYVFTAPGGSFAPNAFQLYDMLGNVWQWVEDCWARSYAGAPADGSARTNGDCSRRVVRGGSWSVKPRDVRSGYRGWMDFGGRTTYVGFRIARTP